MEKTPTAKEILAKHGWSNDDLGLEYGKTLEVAMKEFATIHLMKAKSAFASISPKEDWYRGRFKGSYTDMVDIDNSYPSSNIK